MENSFEYKEIPTEDLPKADHPDSVKELSLDDLPKLAERIRRTLINTLSKTGGHLGPNLGVVELTIALHRVFNTPSDKFVFDVSHQGYVHKMLTGRWDQIDTIRTYEGLNGFLLRTESDHDCYGAGHAGTAVSAALGMAAARDLKGSGEHVISVAGDAAFVNLAHIDVGDVAALQGLAFGHVDRAQPDDGNVFVLQWVGDFGETLKPFAPCDIAQRRAVQIAAVGGLRCVKIGVRVQPEHKQRALNAIGVPHRTQDSAERQGVITAHENRQPVL